jgi:hypothetical protein
MNVQHLVLARISYRWAEIMGCFYPQHELKNDSQVVRKKRSQADWNFMNRV